jgi:hypothetical protein
MGCTVEFSTCIGIQSLIPCDVVAVERSHKVGGASRCGNNITKGSGAYPFSLFYHLG